MIAVKKKKQKEDKSVIKRKVKFEDYKKSLEATQLINKINEPTK